MIGQCNIHCSMFLSLAFIITKRFGSYTFISGIIIITKKTFCYLYYIRLYKIVRSMHDVVDVTCTVLCHPHLVVCQNCDWIAVSGSSLFSLFRVCSPLCMCQDSNWIVGILNHPVRHNPNLANQSPTRTSIER